MSFEEADAYLASLGIDAMKHTAPSLDRIRAVCELLDHPERAIPAIHVTGTNGKTSTARIVTSLLKAMGLTVGTYTSPHLESVRERIALSGEPLSEEAFGEAFDHLAPYLEVVENKMGEGLTYFEVLTALYFLWAAEAPVDVSVIEVGLGGRWDATNVIHAPVSVVTNVSLDHTGLLGTDRTTIAAEKAGIIKPDGRLVTAERRPDVLEVLLAEAEGLGAAASVIDRDFAVEDNRVALGGRYVSVRSSAGLYEGMFLPLHGAHQGVNAATSIEAVTRFLPSRELEEDVVAEGLLGATAPGRLETIVKGDDKGSPVVLDVAHNPDGMSALVSSLSEAFAFERAIVVIGVLGDKDFEGMLMELTRIPAELVITSPTSVRSVDPAGMLTAAEKLGLTGRVVDGVEEAVDAALEQAGSDDLVCITGSHYVVGEARSYLLRSDAERV